MIRKYAEIFCWKNVSSFCSAKATHIFSAKYIRILYIESAKTVNEMTLNELVKLTLWTTGPCFLLSPENRRWHYMKCQSLCFGEKYEKNIFNLSAEFVHRVVMVKCITKVKALQRTSCNACYEYIFKLFEWCNSNIILMLSIWTDRPEQTVH